MFGIFLHSKKTLSVSFVVLFHWYVEFGIVMIFSWAGYVQNIGSCSCSNSRVGLFCWYSQLLVIESSNCFNFIMFSKFWYWKLEHDRFLLTVNKWLFHCFQYRICWAGEKGLTPPTGQDQPQEKVDILDFSCLTPSVFGRKYFHWLFLLQLFVCVFNTVANITWFWTDVQWPWSQVSEIDLKLWIKYTSWHYISYRWTDLGVLSIWILQVLLGQQLLWMELEELVLQVKQSLSL